jgi:hypothetical protein
MNFINHLIVKYIVVENDIKGKRTLEYSTSTSWKYTFHSFEEKNQTIIDRKTDKHINDNLNDLFDFLDTHGYSYIIYQSVKRGKSMERHMFGSYFLILNGFMIEPNAGIFEIMDRKMNLFDAK